MRGNIIIVAFLVCLLAGGYFLENLSFFTDIRSSLRSQTVPTSILRYGKVAKIVTSQELVEVTPNDYSRFPVPKKGEIEIGDLLFPRKRQIGDHLYKVNLDWPKKALKGLDIDEKEFRDGWPLLSIVVDADDLYSPDKGIITNNDNRGREWERRAHVSYYEDGKLLFSTVAGLRLHGGKSRLSARSFRLCFREEYGADQFKPGLLFGPEIGAVRSLVVHYEWPRQMPFTTCLASDICKRIGCVVPEARPAMLLINGKRHGIYFLSEHIKKKNWAQRIGHPDFVIFDYRNPNNTITRTLHSKLVRWAENRSVQMTLDEARKYVDVDNLSRFIFSIVFLGNTDGFQGMGVLDTVTPGSKWSWINWDMDHSFWDCYGAPGKRHLWEQQAWQLVAKLRDDSGLHAQKMHDPRYIIFRRLLKESPEYRDYFTRLVMDLLNHRISPDYLNSRLDHYDNLAISYGKKNLGPEEMDLLLEQYPDFVIRQWRQHYGKDITNPIAGKSYGIDFEIDNYPGRNAYLGGIIRLFMQHRSHFVREDMCKYINVGESIGCRVDGPGGIEYNIDGYPETSGYKGWYFQGAIITVDITSSEREVFSHWLVNDERIDGSHLVYPVVSETVINPIFR